MMKVAVMLALVAVVASAPDKRSLFHHIAHAVEHVAHEVGHAVEHAVHEVGDGLEHVAQEVIHITGLDHISAEELACEIYPHVKDAGEAACAAECAALLVEAPFAIPVCPPACHIVFHEIGKSVNC